MDIAPMGTLTIARVCGDIPCGQCAACLHRAQFHAASYIHRTVEENEEGDRKTALKGLLECLGLL